MSVESHFQSLTIDSGKKEENEENEENGEESEVEEWEQLEEQLDDEANTNHMWRDSKNPQKLERGLILPSS